MLITQLNNIQRMITQADQKVGKDAYDRYADLVKEMAAIEAQLKKLGRLLNCRLTIIRANVRFRQASTHHKDFGFLVDVPEIRTLIDETRRLTGEIADTAARVEALRPAFGKLLAADGWLPKEYGEPDLKSGMGGGIGQYALYRAEDGSLCLFSLVIPAGSETPIHDHLAWGLIGVYRGTQDETVYRRLDDGRDESKANLEVARRQTVKRGAVLHAAAAARRHSLRQDGVEDAVDLDPPARQRHRLRHAPSLRRDQRRRHAVPIRLQQCRTCPPRHLRVRDGCVPCERCVKCRSHSWCTRTVPHCFRA